jgi:murein L,D-transpeptidase YafK
MPGNKLNLLRSGSSRRDLLAGVAAAVLANGVTAGYARAGLDPVARILVEKSKRQVALLNASGEIIRVFRAAFGRRPGPKLHEGDGRTPEGLYHVDAFHPTSDYYRAVRISYPNEEDRRRAAALGLYPGSQIMLHGLDPAIEAKWKDEHWMFNWTQGCIAVTNHEMDFIWASAQLGTPVEIRP